MAKCTAWQAPATVRPSEAAKQTGFNEREPPAVNQIQAGMSIKAGLTLVVQRTNNVKFDVMAHIADNGQLALVKT